MKTETLLNLLTKININDIVDMGEDVDGNPIFAIKIGDKVCSFIYGDMNLDDFAEWSEYS